MDKKSIISVFILTVLLFGMNQWFSARYETKNQESIKHQQSMAKAKQRSIETRRITIQDLPLIKLYSSPSEDSAISYALNYKGLFLTLGWEPKIPSEVYIKDNGSYKPAKLIVSNENYENCAVYSFSDSQKIPSTYLPTVGASDLQIVSIDGKKVTTALAEYENHIVTFPNNDPLSGIALYSIEGALVPVGFYNHTENKYYALSEIPKLKNKISYLLFEDNSLRSNEKFYVLENDYLQLVFSNIGASITEINLPFESQNNKNSIVKPIEIDRLLQSKYPYNEQFPLHEYWSVNDNGSMQVKRPSLGGYYPLLRRGIRNDEGKLIHKVPYKYYSMQFITHTEESIPLYKVVQFTNESITFESSNKGKSIRKTYTLAKKNAAPYAFTMECKTNQPTSDLWISTGIPEVELISGAFMPALKYTFYKNGVLMPEKIATPKNITALSDIDPNWISNANGFFGVILNPINNPSIRGIKAMKVPGEAVPTRLSIINPKSPEYPANKYPGYQMLLSTGTDNPSQKYHIFAGPFQKNILEEVDIAFTQFPNEPNPEYTLAPTYHGWFSFISVPFAKFLFILMNFFHLITGSWGISIILLTVALRVMLYPLNAWSIKSTLKLQKLSPKITALQNRYKKDPKRAQIEVMKLYKEHGVNPFSGCFPILIQMPFLIGMFDLLKSTFQLRGAGFIPGWINNLTAPDVLFTWNFNIPFIGNEFHLLPILLGLAMFAQQRFSQAMNKGKATTTEQQKQQQAMGNIMTIVFTVIFYKMPSGLNIYFLSSTLLSMLQQWYMQKKFSKENTGNE